ncbi:hypothetical protein U1Q18_036335 [Sarracenia purpurea var. burkii]
MSEDDHLLEKFDHRSSSEMAHASLEKLNTLMSSRFEILERHLDVIDIQIQDLHAKAKRINEDVTGNRSETIRVGHAISEIHYRMREIDHRVLCLNNNVCATLATARLSSENPAQIDLKKPVS